MGRHRDRRRHACGDRRSALPSGRWALAAALVLFGGAGLAGCGDHAGSSSTKPPAAGAAVRAELLFVVQATGASIAAPGEGRRPILHLTGVAPNLLAFADRPLRIAASRPAATLVERWTEYGFTTDPPNGALSVGGGTLEEPLALELREPRYDAAAGTLDFAVSALSSLLQVEAQASSRGDLPLLENNIGLFLDDLQQALDASFTSEDRRLLTRALVQMIGGAAA